MAVEDNETIFDAFWDYVLNDSELDQMNRGNGTWFRKSRHKSTTDDTFLDYFACSTAQEHEAPPNIQSPQKQIPAKPQQQPTQQPQPFSVRITSRLSHKTEPSSLQRFNALVEKPVDAKRINSFSASRLVCKKANFDDGSVPYKPRQRPSNPAPALDSREDTETNTFTTYQPSKATANSKEQQRNIFGVRRPAIVSEQRVSRNRKGLSRHKRNISGFEDLFDPFELDDTFLEEEKREIIL